MFGDLLGSANAANNSGPVVSNVLVNPLRVVSSFKFLFPNRNSIFATPKLPDGRPDSLCVPAIVKNALLIISGVMPIPLSVMVIVRLFSSVSTLIFPSAKPLTTKASLIASNAFWNISLTVIGAISDMLPYNCGPNRFAIRPIFAPGSARKVPSPVSSNDLLRSSCSCATAFSDRGLPRSAVPRSIGAGCPGGVSTAPGCSSAPTPVGAVGGSVVSTPVAGGVAVPPGGTFGPGPLGTLGPVPLGGLLGGSGASKLSSGWVANSGLLRIAASLVRVSSGT